MTTVALSRPASPGIGLGSEPWRRPHYLLLVGLALLQALIRAEVPLGQDMLWGARFGENFLDTGHLAHVDTYSWTAHGRLWIPNSWAWNVVLGATYRAMGIVGFWVLGAVLAVVMAVVFGYVCRTLRVPPLAALAVYAPVGFLGLAAVPRAQTVSTIVLLLIPPLVVRVLSSGRARAWRTVGLLFVGQIVWINVHSAALIGPVFVLVCGAAALTRACDVPLRARVLRLGCSVVVTAVGCLITPYGTAPLRHANDVRSASVGLVTEWDSVGFGGIAQLLGLLAVVAAAGLVWRVWRLGRPEVAAAIALLAATTASAIRFLPMLAVFAGPEVALVVAGLNVRRRMFRVIVAATTAVLALIAALDMRDLRTIGVTVSQRLINELPTGCRLLNDDLVGDAVTLLRPDVPVALDGRNDMYGRQIIITVEDMFADKPGTQAALRRDDVTCILGPTSMALVRGLRTDPHWRVAGQDAARTLLLRTGAGG